MHVQAQASSLYVQEQKSKLVGVNKQKTVWSTDPAFVLPSHLKALNLEIPEFTEIENHGFVFENDRTNVKPKSRDFEHQQNALNFIN